MKIKLLYFASIKEALNCGDENFDGEAATVADLITLLSERDVHWRNTLEQDSILIAVNQTISDTSTKLKDGDEVAFFPPVTGG